MNKRYSLTIKFSLICIFLLVGLAEVTQGRLYEWDKYVRSTCLSINSEVSRSALSCILPEGLKHTDSRSIMVNEYISCLTSFCVNPSMNRSEALTIYNTNTGTGYSTASTNLYKGKYAFHIITEGISGIRNGKSMQAAIILESLFWKDWWFKVLIIIPSVILIILGHRFWYNRIDRQKKQLEEIVKRRTEELQSEIQVRTKIENILRQSEERFRALIENASDAIQIISPEMEALYSSPSVKRLLRVLENENNDLNILNFLKEEDRDKLKSKIAFLIESRAGYDSLICNAVDFRGYDLILDISASNQMNNPAVNGIILNIRNITESQKAEEGLKESEERYRKLIELSPLGISFHIDGRFVFVNPAGMRLIGAKVPEDIIGRHILDVVHPDYRDLVISRIKQMSNEETSVPLIEEKLITLDGREIDAAVAAIAFHYHGKLAHQVVIQDMSQFKKAEETIKRSEIKLRELNDNKDKFFSIIAHDLKSPFTSLLGYSELLVSEFDSFTPMEVKNSVNIMNKSIRKIFSLIENLLQWSRIQSGKIEYLPQIINLHELVDNTIMLLEVNAISKNIKLFNEICRPVRIYADQNMISSVLQNLISNSIKFTGQGGQVRIYSEKAEAGFVKINVADNGIGIEQDAIEKLFKIEVHHSTLGTNEEKGTGLGLILCKELIEKNGGHIQVSSRKGEGSVFSFLLPEIQTSSQNKQGN